MLEVRITGWALLLVTVHPRGRRDWDVGAARLRQEELRRLEARVLDGSVHMD